MLGCFTFVLKEHCSRSPGWTLQYHITSNFALHALPLPLQYHITWYIVGPAGGWYPIIESGYPTPTNTTNIVGDKESSCKLFYEVKELLLLDFSLLQSAFVQLAHDPDFWACWQPSVWWIEWDIIYSVYYTHMHIHTIERDIKNVIS